MSKTRAAGKISAATIGADQLGLLYNFDIDESELKPQHKIWLDKTAVPLLVHSLTSVWINGTTSRTGPTGYNQKLSERRAAAVATYLAAKISKTRICVTCKNVAGIGESKLLTTLNEDDRDRSVLVYIEPVKMYKKIIRPKYQRRHIAYVAPPPKPIKSQRFSIRMFREMSAGEVINRHFIYFDIVDETNNYIASYMYDGWNIGVGTPGSVSFEGPWNEFFTTQPLSCNQFGGDAKIGSMGAGPYSASYLELPTPSGMPNVRIKPFETGLTLGAGVSPIGGGNMYLISPARMRLSDEY